jgi:hypothetical protein
MSNQSVDSDRKNLVFFFLFVLLVLAFLIMSLVYVTIVYYSGSLISKTVLFVGIVLVGAISLILVQAYIKKEVIGNHFPICHDILEEYIVCARCRGFYIGFALFGIMIAVRNYIFVDLFRIIGSYPYLVITFIVMASVPIHGSLRRLGIVRSDRLLQFVGFVFSSSIYLFASLLIALMYAI